MSKFKKTRDIETPVINSVTAETLKQKEESIINAAPGTTIIEKTIVDNKVPVIKETQIVKSVPLDQGVVRMLERLAKSEDRSERKITSRLLTAAIKAEYVNLFG